MGLRMMRIMNRLRARVHRVMLCPAMIRRPHIPVVGIPGSRASQSRGLWCLKPRFWRRRTRSIGGRVRGRPRLVRDGSEVLLAALVALEFPLLDKLLSLGADHPIVTVRQLAFLSIIDRPPSGADVDAARNAHLGAGAALLLVWRRLCRLAVAVGLVCAVGSSRRSRSSNRCPPCWSLSQGSGDLRGHGHEVGFAHGTGEREVCLLEALHKMLQIAECLRRIVAVGMHLFSDAMDGDLSRKMVLTP
jgi:hypothetical protein